MSEGKFVNHWGKWVDSETPTTGVYNIGDIAWECVDDEHCLTCEEIIEEIEAERKDAIRYKRGAVRDELNEYYDNELEYLECDAGHTRIFGDWLQDKDGLWGYDPAGEFAAIENEMTVQVIYSVTTKRGSLCSPCYPGQVDADSDGDFLYYSLPDWALRGEE